MDPTSSETPPTGMRPDHMNILRWVGGILLVGFCAASLMAVLTVTKRIAVELPSPSLKLKQIDGRTAVNRFEVPSPIVRRIA